MRSCGFCGCVCYGTNTGMKPNTCPQKTRLLDAYQEAVSAHSNALMELRRNMGVMTKKEYEETYRNVELLRMNARMAQEALDIHVAEHEC